MDVLTLAGFAAALALSTASPGPTITTLVARVIARGRNGALPFCAGLILGDVIWLVAAVFGLSLLAEAAQPVLAVLKWAGVAFLLWLAWKAWTAPVVLPGQGAASPLRGEGARLAATGITLTLGNPKTMLFYTAITPALLDVGRVDAAGLGALAVVLVVVYAGVLAAYVAAALRARHLLRSTRAVRAVNRTAGVAMAGAAAAVATR
jgi:threonine/homoserine/homoserine lactone efflux protein